MLVADPAMVSHEMIEDVLKFEAAGRRRNRAQSVIEGTFAGGRQALQLTSRLGDLTVPVQVIWGQQDQIIRAPQRRHLRRASGCTCSMTPAAWCTWKRPPRSTS